MVKANIIISNATFSKKISHIMNASLLNVDFDIPFKYIEEGSITYGIRGRITKTNKPDDKGMKNVKITAYKNGIIYDFTYTKSEINDLGEVTDGVYYMFLESGTYDIRIESEVFTRTINNYQVKNEDGIQQYKKSFENGQIKTKYPQNQTIQNVIEIDGLNNQSLIVGKIIDQHGLLVNNAELVIINSETKEVNAFIKTKKDGKFSFMLDNGIYDVILRSPKHNAKIIRNYSFNMDNGFLLDVLETNNSFNGGDWIWISI